MHRRTYSSFILSLMIFLSTLCFSSYAQSLTQTFYIDFGQDNPSQGRRLSNVDDNGNHWNNMVAPNGSPSTLNAGVIVNLKSSANQTTAYSLELLRSIRSNGGSNGGLSNPDSNLLGDLAVATATEDYFFLDGNMGKGLFRFNNLDRDKAYKFYIYGCRTASGSQRGIIYSLSGKNGSHGSQLNTGTAIGDDGYNGNNNNVWVSTPIFPNERGEILLELGRMFNNQMAYISALKMEEYKGEILPVAEQSFLIDFGKNNNGLDGAQTLSPDINRNFWNNVYSNGDNWTIGASDGTDKLSLKSTTNTSTDYSLEIASEIRFNGVRNGALGGNDSPNEPKAELLGDLAIKTATYDYFFIENNASQSAIINFKNLNKSKQYRFHIFGSRTDSGNEGRIGRIELIGGNKIMGIHQMGGAGIGSNGENYNNQNIFISDMIIPNADGEISLQLTHWLGFSHINCMKIEEFEGQELPEADALVISGSKQITTCGGWSQLSVSALPQGALAPPVSWTIDNDELAYITESGKLYAKSNGDVVVTASSISDTKEPLVATYEVEIRRQNIRDHSFTVMGSSVPWGQGASPHDKNGYAWLWTDYLINQSTNDWVTNNISIGGNTTTDVSNRWDTDLLPSCSKYVFYGLSLGNEGIHERGEPAYISWRDNMLLLIDRTIAHNKVPIVGNNYPRSDFNAKDYNYLKQLNLLIHQWDVASVNLLGSIDDGAGRWAQGYIADNAHPNTLGHAEMFYAIVPSLLDALSMGKPQPVRDLDASISLKKGTTVQQISFQPEHITHSFTLSFAFKTTDTGTLASIELSSGEKESIYLDKDGLINYQTQQSTVALNDDEWHTMTLTHYYAWGTTRMYIDGKRIPRSTLINEQLIPKKITINDFDNPPQEVEYKDLFFYRAGMTQEEIKEIDAGKMLKSSLEIYAPLSIEEGKSELENLAQSLNTVNLEEKSLAGTYTPIHTISMDEVKEVIAYSVTGQLLYHSFDNNLDFMKRLTRGVYIIQMKTKDGRWILSKETI